MMRNKDILKVIIVVLLFMSASALVAVRQWRGAQAGTAAKYPVLGAAGPVEAPSLPEGSYYVHGNPSTLAYSSGKYLTVACGAGEIRIFFETGEAEFINCDPSDASKSLWIGLKPFFNDCRRYDEKDR